MDNTYAYTAFTSLMNIYKGVITISDVTDFSGTNNGFIDVVFLIFT